MGPDTETTQTEPADVSQFRQGTVNPFLQGLFQNPFGEFQAGPAGQPQNLGFIDRGAAAFGGGPGGGMTSTGNPFARFLSQNPEQQVLQSQFDALSGLSQGGGLGAAQQVVGSAAPIFGRNLQQASAEFASQSPSTFNTSFGAGLGNLQSRALQDFNLFAGQALQQGQQTGLQAAQALGGLGQAAGQAQQRFINPTLQLMLGGMGLAQPMPADVAAQPGLFSQILQAGGTAAGLAAGSSVRFKKNITPLDKIRNLNLYEYNYIGSDRRRVGAIVEDETTPDEWIVGESYIDLYEMMSTLAGAVSKLAEKVEELE